MYPIHDLERLHDLLPYLGFTRTCTLRSICSTSLLGPSPNSFDYVDMNVIVRMLTRSLAKKA